MQVPGCWGHIGFGCLDVPNTGRVWLSPPGLPSRLQPEPSSSLVGTGAAVAKWGRSRTPSSITPAPGTLWSSWNGSWSLRGDESLGSPVLEPVPAAQVEFGGQSSPQGPAGGCQSWGRDSGSVSLSLGSWERALRRWSGDEPAVAQMWPLRARGGSGSFWRGFNLLWNCCRWHGRKEWRNMACQGRVPYFKLLPLPGNKYASLQNNNYKAWEKIQGTQNPSVGVGVLADARLGVFGGNVIPEGHGWLRVVLGLKKGQMCSLLPGTPRMHHVPAATSHAKPPGRGVAS